MPATVHQLAFVSLGLMTSSNFDESELKSSASLLDGAEGYESVLLIANSKQTHTKWMNPSQLVFCKNIHSHESKADYKVYKLSFQNRKL